MGGRRAGDPAAILVVVLLAALLCGRAAFAGPYIEPGDVALRHDIQLLADHGIISGPVSSWPLAWGPVLEALREADAADLSPMLADAYMRIRTRARWETRSNELHFDATIAAANAPTRIRSFQNTPRGDLQVSAGVDWTGDWLSLDLNVQGVDSDQDSRNARIDNSMIGIVAGNWSIAASTQERWWGPGWDGSLILSNNARPIPSLVIDRIFTDAFESKWLRWIGPWDLTVMFGQLEEDRVVPNAQFFGMRLSFRPLNSLEIGVSRTAHWCGDGRPCDFDTFVDLLIGRDNIGDAGISTDNEPGNQLAGIDARWVMGRPRVSIYGQLIGEDEAGGLPSRYIGQIGGDWSGFLSGRWSTRVYAEIANTRCNFYESDQRFNCAYNHGTYETGYRYRGRAIGHGVDNDARIVSFGAIVVDADETTWQASLRYGELNRGGSPDPRNTLTATQQDLASLDVFHSRAFGFGVVQIGVGIETINDAASQSDSTDGRAFIAWRSSF